MQAHRTLSVTVVVTLAAACTLAAEPWIEPGQRLERDLEPGATSEHRIDLDHAGPYLLSVEQHGIDVVVTVRDPGGRDLVAVDSPLDRQGSEIAYFEADAAGVHGVEIRSRETQGAPGRYVLSLADLEGNPRRAAAAFASTEAAQLYLEGTPDAWRRALRAHVSAFELWLALGEDLAAARERYGNAVLLRLLEGNRRALDLAQQVLPMWEAHGDRIFAANTLNEIALNQWHLRHVGDARESFERARDIHRSVGHAWGTAVTSANLCLMDLEQGKLRASARCHEQTLPLLLEVKALDLAGTVASNLGRTYDLLGEPDRALEAYRQGLELAGLVQDRRLEGQVLNNLGVLQRQVGEPQEALSSFDRALEIFEAAGSHRWRGYVLGNVGATYQALGQLELARIHYLRASEAWRGSADPTREAEVLVDLGLVFRQLGRPEEAERVLGQAREIWKSAGDARQEARALAHLGRVAMDRADPAAAAQRLSRAATTLARTADRIAEADALVDLGGAEAALGRSESARNAVRRGLELAKASGVSLTQARAHAALARLERRAGAADPARRHVDKAIELLETDRIRIRTPNLRATFLATFHGLYRLLIDLLLDAGHPAAALEASERARARTLVELLGEDSRELHGEGDPDLQERRRSLLRRLDAKAELAATVSLEPEARATLAAEQAEILRQLDVVEAALRRDPLSQSVDHVDVKEIQHGLDVETLLLVFSLGDEKSVLWRVDPVSVTAYQLPGRERIEHASRRVHESLQRHDPAERARDAVARSALAEMLLGPVVSELDGRRLAIVPDGALAYVPFEALPAPGWLRGASGSSDLDASAVLLQDRFEIVYLPSASTLVMQRRRSPGAHDGSVAVLADPVVSRTDPRVAAKIAGAESAPGAETPALGRLSATRREAESIAALAAPREVEAAFGFQANRDLVLKGGLSEHELVHFATHGVVDSSSPALSALVLSRYDGDGRAREGFLGLRDIRRLRLNAELVVLSGCSTALGAEIRGEGLWGLAHGFFSAGARRVLASLWRVEDQATAELMRRFYGAMWQHGMTPAAALRSAKLSLSAERRWRDPHFWAGFVLQGDWR